MERTIGEEVAKLLGNEPKVEGVGKGQKLHYYQAISFLKTKFTEKTQQNLTGKASVKLLIGITQRTKKQFFLYDTDTE